MASGRNRVVVRGDGDAHQRSVACHARRQPSGRSHAGLVGRDSLKKPPLPARFMPVVVREQTTPPFDVAGLGVDLAERHAPDVSYACVEQEMDLEAGVAHMPAEVDLVEVQGHRLVEEVPAQARDECPAEDHERAGRLIDTDVATRREVAEAECAANSTAEESTVDQPPDPCLRRERHPQGGEGTVGRFRRPVRSDQAASHEAGLLMLLEVFDGGAHGGCVDDDLGVDHRDGSTARRPERLVVPSREVEVVAVED